MKYSDELSCFMDDHFGMFAHWGLYSALAGEWNGRKLEHDELGEWIMYHLQIPLAEYGELIESFIPMPDFAEKWVLAAKKAGIKYIVPTTMHHDGFCLFRSKVNDYNAYNRMGRDLVGELAASCRKHDIKLGFYYSHTLDWSDSNAPGTYFASGGRANDGNTWDFPDEGKKDYNKFLYGKVLPQVRELLTQYGDVLLMWFDYPHDITPAQCHELYSLVKSIQPRCLVNSRIGNILPDYYTLGDNQIPSVPMGVPQESIVTLNDTWGYKQDDHNWKTAEHIIGMLARSASCGSNLMMNVGPTGNGSLTPETLHIMEGIAEWVSRNGEAVYGTRPNPFKAVFDWGYVTQKDSRLYLYLKDGEARTLVINGLQGDVESVTAIGGGPEVPFEQKCAFQGYRSLVIRLPASPYGMPVYCIQCKPGVAADSRILQQDDALELYPLWAKKYHRGSDGDSAVEMRIEHNVHDGNNGKSGLALNRVGIATEWKNGDEYLRWEALVADSGVYELQLLSVHGGHIGSGEFGVTAVIIGPDAIRQIVSADVLPESFRFGLSLTGSDNQRVGSVLGSARITCPGMHGIELHRNGSSEVPLPFVSLRLKRLPEIME